jgi:hypothetical protein
MFLVNQTYFRTQDLFQPSKGMTQMGLGLGWQKLYENTNPNMVDFC